MKRWRARISNARKDKCHTPDKVWYPLAGAGIRRAARATVERGFAEGRYPYACATCHQIHFTKRPPERLGEFWQSLLGGELRAHHGVIELRGGPVRLDFAEVPEGKQVKKNRLRLDLYVSPEAKEQAVAKALGLGATRADDIYDGDDWQVMRDPEGNEFCFVWGAGE